MIISIILAIGLNFDTFSVAVVEGSQMRRASIINSLKIGIFFGMGQVFMALFGAFLGLGFKLIVMNVDHWIAFILLSFVGGKLINESKKKMDCVKQTNIINYKSLFLLVIATSIDALVVGITLAFMENSILTNIIMIGIVTFFVSLIGYHSGKELKKICKSKVKIIGGLILISIGIKILIQHLFFYQ